MTKHLRFLFVMLLAMIWSAGWAAVGDTYKLVTSLEELKSGDVVVLANSTKSGVHKAMGKTVKSKKRNPVTIKIANDEFSYVDGIDEITLEKATDCWYFKSELGYIVSSADAVDVNVKENISDPETKANISFNNSKYTVTIKFGTSKRILTFGGDYWGMYKSTTTTPIKLYKKVVTGNLKSTTLSLGDYANKTFSFTNGVSDDAFTTPTATVTPAEATGAVKYTSSDNDIVTVADNGQLSFTNKKFGSTTISAQFIATGDYANSNTVTYTVVNKEPQKTATEVTFGDKSQQTITLTDGDVTGVVFPKASEKNNIAGTVSYESSNTDVAVVDAEGNVTIKGAYGEATITATFTPTDAETYAASTDSYKVKNERGVVAGTITFDKANGAFEELPSSGYDANGIGNFSFISDSKESFTFDCTRVLKSEGCIQLKKTARTEINKIVSPTFPIFTNGYKVNVIYSSKKGLKLSAGGKDIVGSTTATNDNGGNKGLGANVSISVPANASFVMTSGSEVVYISKIEIIPNKVDETTAITLDENSESNTIEAQTGVNVTLKRSMVANEWNTICLPFDVTMDKAKAAFGDNVKIVELDTKAAVDANVLSFKASTVITAATPYLIKPSAVADEYTFENVDITNKAADYSTTANVDVAFKGIYNMVDITKDVVEFGATYYAAFLGAGNKIYKAGTGMTKGFRAYFAIPKSAAASALRVVIDGTATSIKNIDSEVVESNAPVYNLQGQRVNGNNLTPGIYVKAGKKFVVK